MKILNSIIFKRLLWRYGYALRASNNVRMVTCWALVAVGLIFNSIVFGIGPTTAAFSPSDEAGRYYSAYFQGSFATDAELLSAPSRVFGSVSAGIGWAWGWLRWFAWTVWSVLLVGSLIYTPLAFRDEGSRAWRSASRKFRERRGDGSGGGSRKSAGDKADGKPLTKGEYVLWELGSDFIQEILAHTIFRRR